MTSRAPRSAGTLFVALAILAVGIAALVTTLFLHSPTPIASDWYIGYADAAEPHVVDPNDPQAGVVILLTQLATGLLCALAAVNLILVLRGRSVTTSG